MSDYMMLYIGAASVLYFVLLMIIAVAVYTAGLIFEWRRRR